MGVYLVHPHFSYPHPAPKGPHSMSNLTMKVTTGQPVPESLNIAAGVLALEIARALCKDSTCKLPQRIQTITREGVTVGFQDDFEGLEKGRTGIWLIDMAVASANQGAPKPPPSVLNPESADRTSHTTKWSL